MLENPHSGETLKSQNRRSGSKSCQPVLSVSPEAKEMAWGLSRGAFWGRPCKEPAGGRVGLGILSSPGCLTPPALASPRPKSWDQSESVAGPLWAFSLGSENCLLPSSLGARDPPRATSLATGILHFPGGGPSGCLRTETFETLGYQELSPRTAFKTAQFPESCIETGDKRYHLKSWS